MPTAKKKSHPIGHVKKGALRKSLGLSTTKNMPESDKKIKPGDSKKTRQRKQFALNAKKWKH